MKDILDEYELPIRKDKTVEDILKGVVFSMSVVIIIAILHLYL